MVLGRAQGLMAFQKAKLCVWSFDQTVRASRFGLPVAPFLRDCAADRASFGAVRAHGKDMHGQHMLQVPKHEDSKHECKVKLLPEAFRDPKAYENAWPLQLVGAPYRKP